MTVTLTVGRSGLALLVVALVCGCDAALDPGEDDEREPSEQADEWDEQPLVELDDRAAWTVVDPSSDPLAGHRPTTVDCPVAAWRPELGQLEVQTGVCNYFALAQPSIVELRAGDRVVVDMWHDALDAAAPATGHIAIVMDDVIIGEAEVAIPSAAEVFRFEWTVQDPLPAGTPVVLHLHNHGYNSWTFVAIDAQLNLR